MSIPARRSYSIPLPTGAELVLGPRTLVMGILNVTPDSFADGGLWADPARAVDAALQMEADGADVIDIGGESTRPGAEALPLETELARVMPVIEALALRLRAPISIDTYKADVASRALAAGAAIVNDVSALRYDPALAPVVAQTGAALVLIHNRGRSSMGPFDTVDCGAPDAVLENSLFGRLTPLRGKPGGTLFLREVGKLGPEHQARLLKALTECAKASWPEPMTPRAIASTSEPLFDRALDGTFDLRLFYRLNVMHIDLRQQ